MKAISPEAFERLVLQLLGALGFGVGPESRRGVRRGPDDDGIDGRIDGRIDEDCLGLACPVSTTLARRPTSFSGDRWRSRLQDP